MNSPSDRLRDPSRFNLEPFSGSYLSQEIKRLIASGVVPSDILFKLARVARNEPDPETGSRLPWVILKDLVENAAIPDQLHPATRAIIDGDLPDAIIDWNASINTEVHASFDVMYYGVPDLAAVIEEQGLVEATDPYQKQLHAWTAAKGLWRVMAKRYHPEWFEDPALYYAPTIAFGVVHDASGRTMSRRIIDHTILSDPLVHGIYTEATTVGVKGIGPKGKVSLRALLSEEHPELVEHP